MPYRLVILDWNGTSYDDLKNTAYPSVYHIFKSFGVKPPSLATYRKEITADFMNFYWKHGIPKDINAAQINELRRKFFETRWRAGKLRNGFKRFLEWCQEEGALLAMVSAEDGKVLEKRLNDFGIEYLFYKIVGDANNKERALLDVLDQCDTKAEEAVYIDDTFDGITAAKNLGIGTIGFTAGYNTRQRILAAKPDFPRKNFRNVNSMRDVRNIIKFVNKEDEI